MPLRNIYSIYKQKLSFTKCSELYTLVSVSFMIPFVLFLLPFLFTILQNFYMISYISIWLTFCVLYFQIHLKLLLLIFFLASSVFKDITLHLFFLRNVTFPRLTIILSPVNFQNAFLLNIISSIRILSSLSLTPSLPLCLYPLPCV